MTIYLAAAGALGYAYEKIATHFDVKNPPGEMIDVGGHKLHVQIEGKPTKGVPLVVIETGINDSSHMWQTVRKKLAERTQVLTYDRTGYAWSEKGRGPRTFAKISQELDTIMKIKGISQQSFILVGHSLGGLIIRDYHNRCSDEVRANIKGMVFVDTIHPDLPQPKMSKIKHHIWMLGSKIWYSGACIGVARLIIKCVKIPLFSNHADWTQEKQRIYTKFHFGQAKSFKACLDENASLEQSLEELKNPKPLNDIPIAVIPRDPKISMRPWASQEELKKELLYLEETTKKLMADSKKSSLRYAEGSGHLIHITKPEIIVDEVTKIMDQTTTKATTL